MFYYTIRLPKMFHQMTFEEFLFNSNVNGLVINPKEDCTRTYEFDEIPPNVKSRANINYLISVLERYNKQWESLRTAENRHDLYRSFKIPKKSGGFRQIDAPNSELMSALKQLKSIFEEQFGVLYHTNAFAYIKRRSALDAVKRHQANESRWFGKYDLHNFFGSTTMEFVINMLSMLFPFSEVVKTDYGKTELVKALDLAFLDGGLPQGTPLSPTLTNIMMIPFDYKISKYLRDFDKQSFVYTRYADDFIISSKYDFDFRKVENLIISTLESFRSPFTINRKKTRYGSSSGSNWNLGVMLNNENKITVGHKKKKEFQTILSSYIMDKKNGIQWELGDVQTVEGYRNYYHMVEGDTIDRIIQFLNQKFCVNVIEMIYDDLKISNKKLEVDATDNNFDTFWDSL